MNRIEKVRETVDGILLNMPDAAERRSAYLNIFGVAQSCAILAMKRNENTELAIVAGMLHDIYSCAAANWQDHARKGAEMARDILNGLQIFAEDEIDLVCTSIYHHSDKSQVHDSLDELLKDADVLQHVLYNPLLEIRQNELPRYTALAKELGLEM